jgi:hypothetical protein
VPAAIRAIPGYAVGAGFWVGICVVAALIAAAPYFAVLAGRVRSLDPPTFDITGRATPAPDRATPDRATPDRATVDRATVDRATVESKGN